jgi:small-conductance mechanosensitive channel
MLMIYFVDNACCLGLTSQRVFHRLTSNAVSRHSQYNEKYNTGFHVLKASPLSGHRVRRPLHWIAGLSTAIRDKAKSAAVLFDNFLTVALGAIVNDQDMKHTLKYGIYIVIGVCATISVLGTLGFDTRPVLALFSVLSLTLGLSFKRLLSDTFTALYFLFSRPFKRGDIILLGSEPSKMFGGKVESITMQHLTIEKDDGSRILIPTAAAYGKILIINNEKL